jgi:hypothetical protein
LSDLRAPSDFFLLPSSFFLLPSNDGAGVPVYALDYGPCLASETIRPGEDGLLFRTAAELADRLTMLFGGTAEGIALLARLRARTFRGPRWDEAWAATAGPVFRACHRFPV